MMLPHTMPPLSPCRVGNGLHSISSQFKVGLGWLINAYSSNSIHMGGGATLHKGVGFILLGSLDTTAGPPSLQTSITL